MKDPAKKQQAAISSVIASALLTALKIVAGIMTGSLGIISEAIHSALDLGAAGLTWFSVKISDKPADAHHHYGHAKVESVSALIQAGLLFLASAWVIMEAIERLSRETPSVAVTWPAVAILLLSIVVDISRARHLGKVARETGSQALEADALHFTSDILSSAVALFGLICVALGYPWADPAAGIVVAALIIRAAWTLGKQTIDVLTDAAPEGIAEKVQTIAASVPGVVSIDKTRVKPSGPLIFLEMSISVNRTLSTEKVRDICNAVEKRIRQELPLADMTIDANPVALTDESVAERIHIISHNHGLHAHNVFTNLERQKKLITFDLEIEQRLSIRKAHAQASAIENDLRKEFDGELEIYIHLDPLRSEEHQTMPLSDEEEQSIRSLIIKSASGLDAIRDMHDLRILRTEKQRLFITMHCTFDDDLLLEDAHALTSRLEGRIYQELPDACMVTIHAEPHRMHSVPSSVQTGSDVTTR